MSELLKQLILPITVTILLYVYFNKLGNNKCIIVNNNEKFTVVKHNINDN